MKTKYVYLDNAATSFPKPESVYAAVDKTLRTGCGNPGRSGHRFSLSASKVVDEARMLCARLFHARSPENIVFTNNTTTALNIAIKGVIKPGDHIITSSLEHNSVSRPLKYLEQAGVEVTKTPTDLYNGLNADNLRKAIQSNTKLLVCAHISNVTGTVNDIASISAFCRENSLLFLVDAAQSAGVKPIDVQKIEVDMLAFPGHKGLLGPQGTGGLYIRPGLKLKTILQGGTGNASELLSQPESEPEKFESGTLNTPGLAGLAAGIRFILETGIGQIEQREAVLTSRLIEGVNRMDGVNIVGPGLAQNRGNVVSIRFDKTSASTAVLMMDAAFNIAVRGGLHCASDAHRCAGTLESGGTVRISPNYFNSEDDIDHCLTALKACLKGL